MKFIDFGTSKNVSIIGLGGLHFGVFLDQKDTNDLIFYAKESGINFIDTSPIYGSGNSETIIGKCIKNFRKDFFISTKVGLKKITNKEGNFGVEVYPLTKKNITKSVDNSLKCLLTDYLDLLQLHTYDEETDLSETLDALYELKKTGKVLNFGFCNYSNGSQVDNLVLKAKKIGINFSSCQIHYNLIEKRAEDELIPAFKKNDIMLLSHHSLARGILTGKYLPNKPIPTGSRADLSNRVSRWLLPDVLNFMQDLKELSKSINCSPTSFVISWLVNNKNVSGILVGARNKSQLGQIIAGVNEKITDESFKLIDQLILKNNLLKYTREMPLWFQEK